VLTELRRMLVTRELAPGSAVRQEALAERLGVSRVPLREALKVLEGEGQVTYTAHRGYLVAELSVEDLVEVYRLREILEAEAITVAVTRLSEEDIDEIHRAGEAVDTASRGGDLTEITATNRRFHFLLFDAARMPRLSRSLRHLWDATDVYRSVYFAVAQNRARIHGEHADLVSALRDRDAIRAVAVQAAHRQNSVAAVSAAISQM